MFVLYFKNPSEFSNENYARNENIIKKRIGQITNVLTMRQQVHCLAEGLMHDGQKTIVFLLNPRPKAERNRAHSKPLTLRQPQ